MIPMFSELPKKPMYWAEFAAIEPTPTIAIVACWGWMLVDDPYEQEIYRLARETMQKIVAGKTDVKYADYVFVGMRGNKAQWGPPSA